MDSLENITILHVLLLVYLRLCILRSPMARKGALRFRNILLVSVWMVPLVCKLPYLFLWEYGYVFAVYYNVQCHILSIVPVILMIVLYGMTQYSIKNQRRTNDEVLSTPLATKVKRNDKKTTLLISALVLVIVFCYVPWIV